MKIKNNKNPNKNIKLNENSKLNGNSIIFSFDFFYTNSIKLKCFTNYYSSEKQFNKAYKTFLGIIANTSGKTLEEIHENYEHTHIIQEDKDKNNHKKIMKIIREIKLIESLQSVDTSEFFQIGGNGSFRVIGIKINTKYYPLFLDPHHLIYKSKKHNQKDTNKYKYDKVNEKTTDSKIIVVNFEECIPDKCWTCDVLESYFEDNEI